MKFPLLILLMQGLYCTSVYAQTEKATDPIDLALTQCLNKFENQNTAAMRGCTYRALDDWDKKLNNIYKALKDKLKPGAKSKLTEAQREWIKFQEAEIKLIDATYGASQGTMWTIVRAEKVLHITRQRAIELEILLSALDELSIE